jgi:hypothetical protein
MDQFQFQTEKNKIELLKRKTAPSSEMIGKQDNSQVCYIQRKSIKHMQPQKNKENKQCALVNI